MERILTPRWIAAHVVVVAIAIVFLNLGFWQLRRMEEVQLENTVGESRYTAPPEEASAMIAGAGGDFDSLAYRRAWATGVFDPDNEVLIRSQVHQGTAGFHVITPLVGEDGSAILVNRGWVPLELDEVPVEAALPPVGVVEVEGWLHETQVRQALGPRDPAEGRLVAMSRVDVQRIAEQLPYPLAPVYLVSLEPGTGQLPIPVPEPSFDDDGPHLAYAIQWFGFTLIGLAGYVFLIRGAIRGSD